MSHSPYFESLAQDFENAFQRGNAVEIEQKRCMALAEEQSEEISEEERKELFLILSGQCDGCGK